jgi:erythromycin esterase
MDAWKRHLISSTRPARRFAGEKVAYRAASGHTVDGPRLRLTQARYPALEFAGAGSFIRDWYGRDYLSIGFRPASSHSTSSSTARSSHP